MPLNCVLYFLYLMKLSCSLKIFCTCSCRSACLSRSESQISIETLCNESDWCSDLCLSLLTCCVWRYPQPNKLTIHVHPLAQSVLSPYIMHTDRFIKVWLWFFFFFCCTDSSLYFWGFDDLTNESQPVYRGNLFILSLAASDWFGGIK